MNISTDSLKKLLLEAGYISEEEFDDALKNASELGKNLSDVLIFRGLINEKILGEMLAKYYGVDYAGLRRRVISDEILNLIPEKMARLYRIVPFEVNEKLKTINVAFENPEDFDAQEFVKRHTGFKAVIYYASGDEITKALGQYKRNIKSDFEKVIHENVKQAKVEDDLEKAAEKLPIINIFDTILTFAVAERASDIHIESLGEEVIIRYRIDGALRDIVKLPKGIEKALVARIKILANLKIDENRIPQDGRYKFKLDEEVVALRISIIPGFYGENVVMRILKESARPLSLEELGISGKGLEIIRANVTKPHGMILVTGPTGSGKTTTLYSILNILNTIEVKICTIEDPIEYGVNRVTQVQINPKTGLTFAAGLRSFLRHDPDIIMVGEIRDEETAEIAVHSALTGHLVLSTLHTNTASGAIPRFIDMGVEGFLLSSTVNTIIAQRLVRKICNACINKFTPSPDVIKRLSKVLNTDLSKQKFYKGQGCSECGGKGYSGRIGLYEVFEVTEGVRELIVSKSSADDLQKQAVADGMVTMLQDGLDKVSSGLTTIEEIMRAVRED